MTTLLFATNNQHKIDEIRAATGDLLKVVGLRDAGIDTDIPEPFETLAENAYAKSSAIYAMTGISCFSEDTGLEVDALGGAPGARSARYAGDDRSPEANIDKLLADMLGLSHRGARFRTVISLIMAGSEHQFEGICEGEILQARTGTGGFGYDAIFVPRGAGRSFAEMNTTEKNQFSHRKKAVDQMVVFLQHTLNSKPAN